MTRYLISPAEPPPIKHLGPSSPLPENVGSDIVFEGHGGLVGVQRKTIEDLIASVRPGPGREPRLGKEILQMTSSLAYAFLVVEGQPAWDRDGNLQNQYTQWTTKNHNGVLMSVQSQGITVLTSRNALETCELVEHIADWTSKSEHVSSLISRGKPQKNGWGKLDDKTMAVHVWSGIPGVGPERAARIYDAGLRLLRCGVTVEELMTVDGIGKVTAEKICKSLTS